MFYGRGNSIYELKILSSLYYLSVDYKPKNKARICTQRRAYSSAPRRCFKRATTDRWTLVLSTVLRRAENLVSGIILVVTACCLNNSVTIQPSWLKNIVERILLYTKCQSSCFLASHWARAYHVKVIKFDCLPGNSSEWWIICNGPVNNKIVQTEIRMEQN